MSVTLSNSSLALQQVKATHIFAEGEVEYDLCTIINIVEKSLSCVPFPWGSPQLVFWQTALYDIKVVHF